MFASLSLAYNSCPIKYQISENEITFLDTTVFKGGRFTEKSILDIKTNHKHLAVQDLKKILMENWSLIENQPLLKTIFKRPPIISYKRRKSLKDMLVRAKM